MKTHSDYGPEFMDIVDRMEKGKWHTPDDVMKDFHNMNSVTVTVSQKNIIITVMDCNVRLLTKVAYNTGIVYIM